MSRALSIPLLALACALATAAGFADPAPRLTPAPDGRPSTTFYVCTAGGGVWKTVNNGTTVWVAALGHLWGRNDERGVFKTTDGGATWTKVLYVDDTSGALDLEIDPRDPDVLYATTWHRFRFGAGDMLENGPGSGLWKTTDGGAHWQKLTRGLPRCSGPERTTGRSTSRAMTAAAGRGWTAT